jgi:hypothetical protein
MMKPATISNWACRASANNKDRNGEPTMVEKHLQVSWSVAGKTTNLVSTCSPDDARRKESRSHSARIVDNLESADYSVDFAMTDNSHANE